MTRGTGQLTSLLATALLAAGAVYGQSSQCHLHAPADFPSFSKQPLVIPAVGDERACEDLNRQRFGSRGRCHCSADGIGREVMRPPVYRAPDEADSLP